jgi:hypothetical protein
VAPALLAVVLSLAGAPMKPERWMSGYTRIASDHGGRYAALVGDGVLLRCRTKREVRRLMADNHPFNPYVVRALRRWRRR